MAELTSLYDSNNLKQTLLREIRREMGNVIPINERIGEQLVPQPGYNKVRAVTRSRIGQMADKNTALYPATAGYKSVEPSVGPILEYGPTAKALYSQVYDADQFHHGQRDLLVSDFAKAAANAPNRHTIVRIEAASTTSVTYTQGDGTSRTSALFATSGSPWYTKSGTTASNVVGAALSANSLDLAITRMQTAINWEDDTPMNMNVDGTKLLFVPPALRALAETITGAPSLPLTALSVLGDSVTGDVMNVLAKYNIVPVVSADFSSSTAAYLALASARVLTYATFTPLNVKIVDAAAPQATQISATMEIGAELNPYEFGIIKIAA